LPLGCWTRSSCSTARSVVKLPCETQKGLHPLSYSRTYVILLSAHLLLSLRRGVLRALSPHTPPRDPFA
jgi:hypothetical protein